MREGAYKREIMFDLGFADYVYIVIAVFVGFVVLKVVLSFVSKAPKGLPGPKPLPVIGNLHQISYDKRGYIVFQDLAKKYGPIYSVQLGNIQSIVINNYELAKEALQQRAIEFSGRPKLPSFEVYTDGGKNIGLSSPGPTWVLQRKLAEKGLSKYLEGKKHDQQVYASFSKLVELLKPEVEPVDPSKQLAVAVADMFCGMCFGSSNEKQDDNTKELLQILDDYLATKASNPMLDLFPKLSKVLSVGGKDKQVAKRWMEYLGRKYKEHKDTYDPSKSRGVVDVLIRARQEAEGEVDKDLLSTLTDSHMEQTIGDFLGVGVQTTRLNLLWGLLLVSAHPEIQQKAQAELDRVVGKHRQPKLVDKGKLVYCEAVLMEILRYGSVLPLAFPHSTTSDVELGGYVIKEGTMVYLNLFALHRDEKYWEDPNAFRPERFLTKDGKLLNRPESYLPFSTGHRACLGEALALQQLFLFLVCFLQKFQVSMATDTVADLEPSGNSMFCNPKPHKLVIKERK